MPTTWLRATHPSPLPPLPQSHLSLHHTSCQKLVSRGWAEGEWESWAPAAHILYLENTDQTQSHSSWGRATVCYLVWCGTQTHGEGERSRQVIQDYSADMSFPWTCYSCSIVFCVKRRVQPHLSAPNSPLAPISDAPWTSIDDEIMSSCCLVNAIPFLRQPHSLSSRFPVCSSVNKVSRW